MYNLSVNNITEIKGYENNATNEQYLQITYLDLDNNVKTLLYSPTHNQFDYENNDTEFNVAFGVLMSLAYDILDYGDMRNEFYKITYRYSLEVNRRGYYFNEILDRGSETYVSVNLKNLSDSIHIADDVTYKAITYPDGEFYGLDENNNKVLLEPTTVQLYKTLKLNAGNVICDLQKSFEMSIIQIPNIRFTRDYNARIKNKSIFVRVDTPSVDDFNNLIDKANEYPDIFFNILVYNTLGSLTDDVKDKIREASDVNNIHIYLTVDTDEMNTPYDTVKQDINDIYAEFGSKIDGILLDNIAKLEDDADDATKDQWTAYYMGLKTYLHNYKTEDGDVLRYYIITRHSDNSTYYYQVSNYNNPGDTHIGFTGDMPDTASQLGDPFYNNYKHIMITNKELDDSPETTDFLDLLYKYSLNPYVISSDDFSHPDMVNIDYMCKYLDNVVDKITPVQIRKINPNS